MFSRPQQRLTAAGLAFAVLANALLLALVHPHCQHESHAAHVHHHACGHAHHHHAPDPHDPQPSPEHPDDCTLCRHLAQPTIAGTWDVPEVESELVRPLVICLESRESERPLLLYAARGPPVNS